MGDTLKLNKTVRMLDIEWPNGKKNQYSVDVSGKDRLKQWLDQEKKISALQKYKDGKGLTPDAVDELYATCADLLNNLVGDKQAKDILKKTGGSFFFFFFFIVYM